MRITADRPSIDPLTGIFTRRYLVDRLVAEVASSIRGGAPIVALLADVDGLRGVNDRFGRFAGDRALRAVAAQIRRTVRLEDLLGRYGGNEFVVLALGSNATTGAHLAERLRGAIEGLHMLAERVEVRITVSVGVASMTEIAPSDEHPFALLALADARMNEAKTRGGNRVCGADFAVREAG